MNLIDIILLGIALGIDCFIVSFSQGLIFKSQRRKNFFKLALTMGMFQGIMPVIGYIGTDKIYNHVIPYSKFITSGIFFILGTHFILDAIAHKKENNIQCIDFKCLISLGIATSIDALISGVSLKLTHSHLLISCLLIGIISFIMSGLGFWIGNYIKKLPSKYLHILGGIILIFLGLKSFF